MSLKEGQLSRYSGTTRSYTNVHENHRPGEQQRVRLSIKDPGTRRYLRIALRFDVANC